MIHEMKLNPAPFMSIKNKTKTIELRLKDEKRSDMEKYYTLGDIKKYGVIGIELK